MKRCPQCGRDYNDDSLSFCLDDGSELLFGPSTGESATAILNVPPSELPTRLQTDTASVRPTNVSNRRASAIIAAAAVLVVAAGFIAYRSFSGSSVLPAVLSSSGQQTIKSLAVLPLKPLDASDNYLGMGIADAIIRRMSQTGQLTVRPTSAIRKYLNDDTDGLTAAKQLQTDAVLEGSVQRAEDRLRVSVNLLRTSDGTSLWNDRFDIKMTDIFAVQDMVSQQVASRLSLRLDPSHQAALTKRYTSNPTAYEYFQKAIYAFDSRYENDIAKSQETIELLKKAIESDPNYALAHAQLAYAYAELATYGEPANPNWQKLYEQEIETATQLDPQLAEIHLARHLILWSSYSGYQTKAAIRELLTAQQLDPDIGHGELGFLYGHAGLMDLCARELDRAHEIDPTSDFVKQEIVTRYFLIGDYDGWAAEKHRQFGDKAGEPENALWYLLGKRRLDDAQKQIEEQQKDNANDPRFHSYKAILFALRGNYRAAEDEIPVIVSMQSDKEESYHHVTYNIACMYGIEGKSEEAVKWLKKTAETGYPSYPQFEREVSFDRIKQSAEFVQFMNEMRTEWETYKSEFGGN